MENVWPFLMDWFEGLINGGIYITSFLTQPLSQSIGLTGNMGSLTPLSLLTFGGLVTFLIVAVIKWILS